MDSRKTTGIATTPQFVILKPMKEKYLSAAGLPMSPTEGGGLLRALLPLTREGYFLSLMAVMMCWSTAGVEIVSSLFIAAAFLWSPRSRLVALRTASAVHPRALILWLIYFVAVAASFLASRTAVPLHAGLLWHPLLFPLLLLISIPVEDVRKVFLWFLTSSVAAAVYATLRSFTERPENAFSVFVGVTTLTVLLTAAALGAVVVAARRESGLRIVRWGSVTTFVLAIGVFRSAERAPVALLLLLGTIIILFSRPKFLPVWAVAVGGLLFFVSRALSVRIEFLATGHPVDRMVVWRAGLDLLTRVPLFGFGPGSFASILPQEAWGKFINRPPASWHNDLLQTTIDHGPVAGAALAGLMGIGIWRVLARLRNPIETVFTLRVVGSMFAALLLLGMVNASITSAVLGVAFWVMLGLACREWHDDAS
jgi:hypothetical protein